MPPKLLLADDSVTIQRVIELTFADEHIQVIAVGDGAQAIARIESERPDVVLADVGMPEKDGYEVAAYVKSHPHLRHIPVVLLTGAFEPVDDTRARAIGCDGVLGKPFEPQMVISRVKDLLAGRRPPALWTAAPGEPLKPAERPAAPADQARLDYRTFAPGAPAPETPAPGSADSLDEYFDRLDAAFASLGTEQAAAGAPAAAAESAPAAPIEAAPAPPVEPAPAPAVGRVELVAPGSRGESFADVLDRWDPSLSDEEPAAAPPGAPLGGSAPTAPPILPPMPAPPIPPPMPGRASSPRAPASSPLSSAFAALLAAEQGAPPSPPTRSAPPAEPVAARAVPPPAPVLDDAFVDTVVRRVVERLTTRTVQDMVLQVAERLVREEIERIKNQVR